MLFIHSLVQQLAPQWDSKGLSVACISTTNPVYLVFNEQETHPALAVRIADSEEVCEAHRIIERLYTKVGDLVAEPIALTEIGEHKVAIQKGLMGLPWFQLTRQYQTPAQWETLRNRSLAALIQLHTGIKAFSDWTTDCEPGTELRLCLQRCLAVGTELSPRIQQQVDSLSKQLDQIGSIRVHYQHGDYCLNNLLVEFDQIHVIDFEDFGMTSMPLHDEFALALSMYSSAPNTVQTSPKREINACIESSLANLGLNRSMLPGLFMHHLLLRLGDWSQGSRRQQYRAWLISLLEEFAQDPLLYFE